MTKVAKSHFHFVGVCGVGMSSLAQAAWSVGFEVSGSDRSNESSLLIEQLKNMGIQIVAQDGAGVRDDTSAIVVSTAIESDNPDIKTAREKNIPVIHRSEMLVKLVEGNRLIAITGTSGKSTVTGMLGWILSELGADPSVVNGAQIVNWCDEKRPGNFVGGHSDLWIIEADESDRSLLNYNPDWAVVTNVSKDHFTIEEAKALFETFRGQVKEACINGSEEPALINGFLPQVSESGSSFTYKGIDFHVNLLGQHNAENALLSVILCEKLGYALDAVRDALASFKGIKRRLERVGIVRGVTVFDDYGHNPAKIRAALQAVCPYARKVHIAWRPHGYGPLKLMINELESVFYEVRENSGVIAIMPVYDAGGTADRSMNSDILVDRLRGRGLSTEFISGYENIANTISSVAMDGDVVLVMGARDPGLSDLARKILSRLDST